MTSYIVRTMAAGDLPAVAHVDHAAFSMAAQRSTGHAIEHPRHLLGLEYFRAAAPDLCLVAESPEGNILGYLIGHRWGQTAWTGPLGVDTGHMSRGIGSAMVNEFSGRAESGGATTIGLETSIGHNVRLYEKLGYRSRSLCLRTAKALTEGVQVPGFTPDAGGVIGDYRIDSWSTLSEAQREARLGEARHLAEMINPGLDHGIELAAVPASGIGPTYLAIGPGGQLAGYATLHVRSYRSARLDDRHPPAEPLVWTLVAWPEAAQSLLRAGEAAAAVAGGKRLRVPCYAGNPQAWSALKSWGYRIEDAFVRMMYRGGYAGGADRPWGTVPFDLSTWLG